MNGDGGPAGPDLLQSLWVRWLRRVHDWKVLPRLVGQIAERADTSLFTTSEIHLVLSVARKFEQASMQCEPEDQFLIWTFLLMLWGALRWSDVQRIDFSTLVLDKVSLRGWSWRTKTSVTGMPSGVLVSGIEESDWGKVLGEQLLKMSKEDPCRDFLVGSRGANQLHFNVVSISTLSSSVWRRGAGRRFSLFFA